nr:MAG TPA: hypothetical protein [Caudoviricetes sp.]
MIDCWSIDSIGYFLSTVYVTLDVDFLHNLYHICEI